MTNNRSFGMIYKCVFYIFGFIFGLANGYLFFIGAGIGIALGLLALFIYISCFVSGSLVVSLFESNQSYRQVSCIVLMLFTIVLTVVGQKNNILHGMTDSLSVQSISMLLSGFALGFSSTITLKMLISLWKSNDRQSEATHKNEISSLIIGVINGVLLGIAWSSIISSNFGFIIGVLFGTASSAVGLITRNHSTQFRNNQF
jgi:hypothetical protein